MDETFAYLGLAGYVLVHLSKHKSVQPFILAVLFGIGYVICAALNKLIAWPLGI